MKGWQQKLSRKGSEIKKKKKDGEKYKMKGGKMRQRCCRYKIKEKSKKS